MNIPSFLSKSILFIVAVFALSGCNQDSELLSKHVDKHWASELNEIDASNVQLLKESFSFGELDVCVGEIQLRMFSRCTTTLYINEDEMWAMSGTTVESKNEQWVVSIPSSAKELSAYRAVEIIDLAIRAHVIVEKRRIAIAKTWETDSIQHDSDDIKLKQDDANLMIEVPQ